MAARGRIVFVTHSASAAGAELLMLRMLTNARDPRVRVVFLEDGELVAAFRSRGIETEVIELGGDARGFRRDGAALAALGRAGPAVAASKRLAATLTRDDVVVASSQKAFLVTCLARTQRRFSLCWWLHDILSDEHFSGFVIRTVTTASRIFCRKVIATSPEVRDAYLKAGGAARSVVVVEPGVELDAFAPAAEPERTRPLVLHVSRIAPWKGQAPLIEALALVPEVDCWIAGQPLFGEAGYLEELRARAETLGLGDRVKFLGHCDDVPALLAQGDIFVHVPVAPEPFGQVIVEAMASGLPVVTSQAGALGRIVKPSFGRLVAPGDVDQLARAIRELASGKVDLAEMSRKAREASADYDISEMRQAFFRQLAAA